MKGQIEAKTPDDGNITRMLISALRLVPGAWTAYGGGVLVPVGNYWLRVGLDGTIETGETV